MAKKNLLLLIILSLLFTIIVGIGLDVVKADNVAVDHHPNVVETQADVDLLSFDLPGNDTLSLDRLNTRLVLPNALDLGVRQLLNLGAKLV